MDGIKSLRKALKNKKLDEFEDGTVIKFTSGGMYTYVVIKAGGNWFISSSANFFSVGQRFSYETLIDKILSKADVTDIKIAETWVSL